MTVNVFHARRVLASGVDGGSSVNGFNVIELNTVVKNSITGAALNGGGTVTVPAGRYLIRATSYLYRDNGGRGLLVDVTGDPEIIMESVNVRSNPNHRIGGDQYFSGVFEFADVTELELGSQVNSSRADDGLGRSMSVAGEDEVYGDIQILQLKETTELIWIQRQEPNNTNGGGSGGEVVYPLNTVLYNNMTGASLASSVVTLPAGTFLVEAAGMTYRSSYVRLILAEENAVAPDYLIASVPGRSPDSPFGGDAHQLLGVIHLDEPTNVNLRSWTTGSRADNGFGWAAGLGRPEVYANLLIMRIAN
jgi:hypothetical protein